MLVIACILGYCWLLCNRLWTGEHTLGACFFKSLTTIPCPACGTTRGVLLLFEAQYKAALLLNPLTYLLAAVLLLVPVWMAYDVLFKSSSLFRFYQGMEQALEKPRLKWLAIALVLINWIWNIQKGL